MTAGAGEAQARESRKAVLKLLKGVCGVFQLIGRKDGKADCRVGRKSCNGTRTK